jgi:hypothetical protein
LIFILSGFSSSESGEGSSQVKSILFSSYLGGLPVEDFLTLLEVVTVFDLVVVALAPVSFFIK